MFPFSLIVLNKNKAQGLAELAVLLGLVMAALIGMQVYVKRGLQARYKAIVDAAGDAYGLHQYEPYYASSSMITQQDSDIRYRQAAGTIIMETDDTTIRQGQQKTGSRLEADNDWNR